MLGHEAQGRGCVRRGQAASRYLSKYLGKAFDTAEFCRHRYERAQGFEITRERVVRHDMDDGREYVEYRFAAKAVFEWSSKAVNDWSGPEVLVLFFACAVPDG